MLARDQGAAEAAAARWRSRAPAPTAVEGFQRVLLDLVGEPRRELLRRLTRWDAGRDDATPTRRHRTSWSSTTTPRLRQLLQRYLIQNGYHRDHRRRRRRGQGARARTCAFDLMRARRHDARPGRPRRSPRSCAARASVPILLLTARGAPEDRISGLEAGADDYLAKPFEPRELLLRIATILRRVQADPHRRRRPLRARSPSTAARPSCAATDDVDPPHHRRDLAAAGAGGQARPGDQPGRARRQGRGRPARTGRSTCRWRGCGARSRTIRASRATS